MTRRLLLALMLVCTASTARADEARSAEPPPPDSIADLGLGLTSTAAAVACLNLTPYAGIFVEGCDGLASAFDSYGAAVGFTVPVASWTQSQWTMTGGLPGRKRVHLGPGVGYKKYHACLWLECDDGTAVDLFARFDFYTWWSSVALVARIEGGGSRVEHASGDSEWFPYLGAKIAVAFGR